MLTFYPLIRPVGHKNETIAQIHGIGGHVFASQAICYTDDGHRNVTNDVSLRRTSTGRAECQSSNASAS